MGRFIETTCPSGLTVKVRSLKGGELNLFANKTHAEQRKIGYDLLRAVVTEIVDPGPMYPDFGTAETADWSRVVDADRFWLYIYTRVATFGPDYFFSAKCNVASCQKSFDWGLKIDRDLRAQPISQESVQAFLAGNQIGPVKFGDDEIILQLLTGEIEDNGQKYINAKPDEIKTITLANRIKSVNGETSKKEIHNWVLNLDLFDLMSLTDMLDEHDGGIDTAIEIQCPKCKTVHPVILPLDVDFWTPRKEWRLLPAKGYKIPEGGGPIHQSSDF